MAHLAFDILRTLEAVEASEWDALVSPDDPFFEHLFLLALEQSKSIGTTESGWQIRIITARDEDGRLVAALPLFARTDSYGEFIFDWAWADASMRAGLPYYPKLVSAIPFTPATGRRLLLHPSHKHEEMKVTQALLVRAYALCQADSYSSLHILFHSHEEANFCRAHTMIPRRSFQYHWQKREHWLNFETFLGDMRAPLRKQIRKERRAAASSGLTLTMRRGTELSEQDWGALYTFYRSTIWEKGARAYLTQDFFTRVQKTLGHRVLAAMAHQNGQPVAGALFFTRGKALFGRYWGSLCDVPVLHFELCYYQAIEWALANGIERFEAGAQGEHKLRRGLLPTLCYSSHYLVHPGLAAAVARFTQSEEIAVTQQVAALAPHGPFHRNPASCDTPVSDDLFI